MMAYHRSKSWCSLILCWTRSQSLQEWKYWNANFFFVKFSGLKKVIIVVLMMTLNKSILVYLCLLCSTLHQARYWINIYCSDKCFVFSCSAWLVKGTRCILLYHKYFSQFLNTSTTEEGTHAHQQRGTSSSWFSRHMTDWYIWAN